MRFRTNFFCFLSLLAAAGAPRAASASETARVCRPLTEISRSMKGCRDNRRFSEAAEACLKKVRAQADALSVSMGALIRANAEKSREGGARDLFENHEKNLGEMQATLSSLILTAQEAKREVEDYDSQLIWPMEASPELAQSGKIDAVLSRQGSCYGNNHKLLGNVADSLEKRILEMTSLKASAEGKQKTTSGFDQGLSSQNYGGGLAGGRARGQSTENGQNHSDVTGRSSDALPAAPGPGRGAGTSAQGSRDSLETLAGTGSAQENGAATGTPFETNLEKGRMPAGREPTGAATSSGAATSGSSAPGENEAGARSASTGSIFRDLLLASQNSNGPAPSGSTERAPASEAGSTGHEETPAPSVSLSAESSGEAAASAERGPRAGSQGSRHWAGTAEGPSLFALVHQKLTKLAQDRRI